MTRLISRRTGIPGAVAMICLWLLLPLTVQAADDEREQLRAMLAERYPDFEIDSVRPAPIDGLYEVIAGVDIMYITGDGRYMLQGSLIDLVRQRDLTREMQGRLAHRAVAELASSMLVYEPPGGDARHTVTVFTDHTCPFCQQLHEDLLDMVAEDQVRVRYLMYPRRGPESSAAETLRGIWCADDPHEAMTRAKRGRSVERRARDCQPPLEDHFQTAQRIGISGTPYVLLNEGGPVFAGYRPREELLQMLAGEPPEPVE